MPFASTSQRNRGDDERIEGEEGKKKEEREIEPSRGRRRLESSPIDPSFSMVEAAREDGAATEPAKAVLTQPLSLDGGLAAELRPANLVQRILSLFRDVRPGSDLTRLQLPPVFNLPKSQLQLYGEAVYCVNNSNGVGVGDEEWSLLRRCGEGRSRLERFKAVVAWFISTTRPPIFGLAPYNPVLGETHHVSNGSLHLLLEQVSHHPPVSALHATDDDGSVELVWCHSAVPKFCGTSVEAVIEGKRHLRLLRLKESYEMDSPNLLIRLLPTPSAEWSGNVRVVCRDSGLAAELRFGRSHYSLLGLGGGARSVRGKLFHSTSGETIYEIDGQWDRIVSLRHALSGRVSVLYDGGRAIANLKTPVVRDREGLSPVESAVVWSEVSEAILRKDWGGAREAKKNVEETERRLQREREERGEVWVPRHFSVSRNKEGQWECWPLAPSVPPAPIGIPR